MQNEGALVPSKRMPFKANPMKPLTFYAPCINATFNTRLWSVAAGWLLFFEILLFSSQQTLGVGPFFRGGGGECFCVQRGEGAGNIRLITPRWCIWTFNRLWRGKKCTKMFECVCICPWTSTLEWFPAGFPKPLETCFFPGNANYYTIDMYTFQKLNIE